MFRYLVALIWPAGMAIILGAAFLASRRSQVIPDGPAGAVREAGRHHSRRAGHGSSIAEAVAGSAQAHRRLASSARSWRSA